jgi:hypothetical protein
LVMTMVPGKNFNSYLTTGDNVPPDMLTWISRTIVAALEKCWSTGHLHADLALDNVLCDIVTGDLSFVDAGALDNCALCTSVTRHWQPAVYDLAHVVFDVGVTEKSTIGNRDARLRKQMLAEAVLRTFIETIVPLEKKQLLLDEIHACACAHLTRLELSWWSPYGMWCALIRQIASRRINAVIGTVKAELNSFGEVT